MVNHNNGGKLDSEILKAGVLGCIGSELGQVEKLIRAATTSQYEEVAQLCKSAAAMGGKRLRPTLVWLSARAIAGEQLREQLDSRTSRDLTSIAAAVELVHAASLVHDDVMDGANERRHQPTIVGQAGNSAAVLLGDLLFTRAYALAASCRQTSSSPNCGRCDAIVRRGIASTGLRGPMVNDTSDLSKYVATKNRCPVCCQLSPGRLACWWKHQTCAGNG